MARGVWRNVRSGKRKALIANLDTIARKELEKGLDNVGKALVKSHERIVRDWKTEIKFKSRRIVTPRKISVVVFPTGENAKIWIFVDKGTDEHEIKPKKPGGTLVFRWGGKGSYTPKTMAKPARTVAGGGTVRGPIVYRKKVDHPGSEGRDFSGQIAKTGQRMYRNEIENAFRRAARRVQE